MQKSFKKRIYRTIIEGSAFVYKMIVTYRKRIEKGVEQCIHHFSMSGIESGCFLAIHPASFLFPDIA